MSQFTVIYDANDFRGHDPVEIMAPTTVTMGVATPLRRNTFKNDGYNFVGWKAYRLSDAKHAYINPADKKRRFFTENKQPDGWVPHIYRDGCNVSKLSHVDGDTIVMYAQWELKERTALNADAYKKEIESRLLSKDIVLYGQKKLCINFYRKHSSRLNIRLILLEDDETSDCSGIEIPIEKYKKNLLDKDDFIIICTPVSIRLDAPYCTAKKNIVNAGRKISEDFVREDVARVVLENKKLWLWFGFCQADTLRKEIFQKLESIHNRYVLAAFRYGLDTLKNSYKFDDCKELLKICDCLSYIPVIFADGKMDFDFEDYLALDAKKLTLPRIPFRGYYPYRDSNMEVFHRFSVDGKLHWPFNYSEKIIDDLILSGKSDDDIYNELMREDLIPAEEIQKNLKLAYKFIQISESSSDIKMLDFIKENFHKRWLYRDGLHYQNFMYFEMARRVSAFLNLECEDEINELEETVEKEGKQFIDFTETPILPCVVKTLNLDFISDDTLYRVKFTENGAWRGTKAFIKLMTRKEWIYSYVEYTRACITLCEYWPSDKR